MFKNLISAPLWTVMAPLTISLSLSLIQFLSLPLSLSDHIWALTVAWYRREFKHRALSNVAVVDMLRYSHVAPSFIRLDPAKQHSSLYYVGQSMKYSALKAGLETPVYLIRSVHPTVLTFVSSKVTGSAISLQNPINLTRLQIMKFLESQEMLKKPISNRESQRV